MKSEKTARRINILLKNEDGFALWTVDTISCLFSCESFQGFWDILYIYSSIVLTIVVGEASGKLYLHWLHIPNKSFRA